MPAKKTTSEKETPKKKTAAAKKKATPKRTKGKAIQKEEQVIAEAVVDKTPKKKPAKKTIQKNFTHASGKRKTSTARIRLFENGSGSITVNGVDLTEYITIAEKRSVIKAPLKLTGHLKTFDITVKAGGGGKSGQAEAIRHGIARALAQFDPGLRLTLKRAGFLTRDSRMKERKKYGLHKARRAPQWSKR